MKIKFEANQPYQVDVIHGSDPLKTHAVLEAKSHGIAFRTV